jgi:hypothetical protein
MGQVLPWLPEHERQEERVALERERDAKVQRLRLDIRGSVGEGMSQQTVCSFCSALWGLYWACVRNGISAEFEESDLMGNIQDHMQRFHGMNFTTDIKR